MEYPNWFQGSASNNFEKYLTEYKGKDHLRFLQVGVYTGDASKWLLDNVLTGKGSHLEDVDTWQGSDEGAHHAMDFNDVERVYDQKVSGYNNVKKFKMTSDDFFNKESYGFYDFVYVDADHTSAAAYKDGGNGWNRLKPNGILAFDDYLWGTGLEDQSLAPQQGIDKFLKEIEGQYSEIVKDAQVWIKKNADL